MQRTFSNLTARLAHTSIQNKRFLSIKNVPQTQEVLKEKIEQMNHNQVPLTHQKFSGRKRFYKVVDVVKTGNKYRITLDGKVLRTPGRNPLAFENKSMALAIAAEWDAQTCAKRGIEPATMPLMTLVSTAIDQIQFDRETAIENSMKYFPTDSALFHTDDTDRILLSKQRQHLNPAVRWMSRLLRKEIPTTSSVSGRIQHASETTAAIESILRKMDDFTLACTQGATAECKSIVLALAFLSRHLDLDQVKKASRIEEEFQLEIWGVVEGGHDMDRLNNSVSLSSIDVLMSLHKSDEEIKQLFKFDKSAAHQ